MEGRGKGREREREEKGRRGEVRGGKEMEGEVPGARPTNILV